MVAPVDVLFGLLALGGTALCLLGVYTYRSSEQLGTVPFAIFLGLLGLGSLGSGVFGFLFAPYREGAVTPTWAVFGIVAWLFAVIPWLFFALRYTGTYTQIRWRTVAIVGLPCLGIGGNIALSVLGIGSRVAQLVGSIVSIYALGLMVVGIYLVLQTTNKYGHLSLRQGASIALVPLAGLLGFNTASFFPNTVGVGVVGTAVLGSWVAVGGTALTLFRYETFDSTPAIGTIGERAIARESDDLVFVVNDRGRMIKLNQTATDTLGVDQGAVLGGKLTAVLDYDCAELRDMETVSLDTDDGIKRYDAQVSTITDQHGRELGSLLSLRDVTDRELREQRLAVLNRVLRHNLRNKIEVIRSHAEILDANTTNGHSDSIIKAADSLVELGQGARTIDRFVSESTASTTVDLREAIEQALNDVEQADTTVTVSVDTPDQPAVTTNASALSAALESPIENALAYADTEVRITVAECADSYELTIADDGPGIPAGELESLDAGTETALQHGTGLGLWQLKWAVRTMGGELSFETGDGTIIEIVLPKLATD
jgi:two-component sensor histidine kinase/PAS domain-containing protein